MSVQPFIQEIVTFMVFSQAGSETFITLEMSACEKLSWSIVQLKVKEQTNSFILPFPTVNTVATWGYVLLPALVANWHSQTGSF
jgi:hypothetical protein